MKCDIGFIDNTYEHYYNDDICCIVKCKSCQSPVVVLKAERKPIKNEMEHMINVSRDLFDMNIYALDFSTVSNPRYFHFHLREFKNATD